MAALTITRPTGTERRLYDPSDTAELAVIRAEFDTAITGSLGTITKGGKSETVRRGDDIPAEEVEVIVQPQYAGG